MPGVQRTHGLRSLAKPERNGDLGRGRRPVLVVPQVRLLSSVPRAVFEAFLCWPPVAEWLPTALDPDSAWPSGTELRRCRQRAR